MKTVTLLAILVPMAAIAAGGAWMLTVADRSEEAVETAQTTAPSGATSGTTQPPQAAAPQMSTPPVVISGDIDRGEQLYLTSCAACHGTNLEGQEGWRSAGPDGVFPAPPHNDDGHTWHHGDQLLTDYIKLGGAELMRRQGMADFKSGMPGFGEILEDDEIQDILAYIKSNWSERSQQVQATRSAAERAQAQ